MFSWNLYPRILDVDVELQKNSNLRDRVLGWEFGIEEEGFLMQFGIDSV